MRVDLQRLFDRRGLLEKLADARLGRLQVGDLALDIDELLSHIHTAGLLAEHPPGGLANALERRVELVDRHSHLDDGLGLVLLAIVGACLQHVAARLRGDRADPAQRDLDIGNF